MLKWLLSCEYLYLIAYSVFGENIENNTQSIDQFLYVMLFNTQKMGKSSITCKKAVF